MERPDTNPVRTRPKIMTSEVSSPVTKFSSCGVGSLGTGVFLRDRRRGTTPGPEGRGSRPCSLLLRTPDSSPKDFSFNLLSTYLNHSLSFGAM